MKTRYLKIKQGIAESDCFFEQTSVRGCNFKVLICIPKEFEAQSIRYVKKINWSKHGFEIHLHKTPFIQL
jgi:hypothetical protein